VDFTLQVPLSAVHSVTADTADTDATHGQIHFISTMSSHGCELRFTVPRTVLSTILIVE